jgi:Na+/proline symporter
MMAIGVYGYFKSTSNMSEYMLGGRQLHPAVVALSAGASDMSGWMLMGLPGAIYLFGLGSAWIAVGLVIGAYLNYLLVAPRLRVYTEEADDAITIPDYFEKRFHYAFFHPWSSLSFSPFIPRQVLSPVGNCSRHRLGLTIK